MQREKVITGQHPTHKRAWVPVVKSTETVVGRTCLPRALLSERFRELFLRLLPNWNELDTIKVLL
jgi:hypothetical protein